MFYARLDGHVLADLMDKQMGMPIFEFLRGYIAKRQRDGVFRAGDAGAMTMFLFSSAWQQATYKYVFGVDVLSIPDEQRVKELSEMILGGLRVSPKEVTKRSKKKVKV
jgi:hypothetical protein